MKYSHDFCYKVIQSKDARFDGLFFTGVKTTGIYCRPVCKVPAPKSENCTFYETAALAEAHGYRPCLRCRPELAPAYSEFAQGDNLFKMMVEHLETMKYRPGSVKALSEYFGVTPRHIHRLFIENIGVSPRDYMMTQRLLRAKTMITDTNLTFVEIGFLSGFGSISSFNKAFKKHYGMTPGDLRKSQHKTQGAVQVKLSYRPPYDWAAMFDFLSMRIVPGVEEVHHQTYRRLLKIEAQEVYTGWIEVRPKPEDNYLLLRMDRSLSPVITSVIKAVRKAFDLDQRPDLLPLTLPRGLRLPGCFDLFEMSVRAILGQQITVKAAHTLVGRLVEHYGQPTESPFEGLTHVFPSPESLLSYKKPLKELLGPLGIISSRSGAIEALAITLNQGGLSFDMPQESFRNTLLSIKGIGEWTADYLTMRGLHWPDIFLVSDVGIKHALLPEMDLQPLDRTLSKYHMDKKFRQMALDYAEAYKPWRSYLNIALWQSLKE